MPEFITLPGNNYFHISKLSSCLLEERIIKIILILFFISFNIHAQSYSIRGKVSASNQPVKFALVTFIDVSDTTKKFSTLTDISGNYKIDIVTSVKKEEPVAPKTIELAQNYPNPFSTETQIPYKLNKQSDIAIKIYNILGQLVKEFSVGTESAGLHGIIWDGKNNLGQRASPGVYLYQLRTQNETSVRKMVLFSGNGANISLRGINMLPYGNESLKVQKALGRQGEQYTVRVASIDSTEPRIVTINTTGILVGKDTTIDFTVKKAPVALISGNQPVRVGQYLLLEGSKSIAGDDGDTLIYKWAAVQDNPSYVYVDATSRSQMLEFYFKGVYKFILVVNNGYTDSLPDTATVVVDSRNKISIADSCLEISLRATLRVPTEDITDSMLLTLDTLVCISGYYFITSLDGIEKCTNLKFLGLANQRLTNLSLISGLTQLEELELGGNRNITDILPLANLTRLKVLNLEQNKISDITPLKNMTKMINLNLINNPIADISSLKDMKELEQFWIENPVPRTFYPMTGASVIAKFTKLWLLWISGYDCRDLSFVSNLDSLRYLRLSFCNVKDISQVENLTRLERLYMDSDSISDISPLSKLTNLNILDLRYNQITNIKPLLDNSGLGKGDAVGLNSNPLDSVSINQYIPALRNRGVTVYY